MRNRYDGEGWSPALKVYAGVLAVFIAWLVYQLAVHAGHALAGALR